jgi:hypothetical protein
MSSYSEGQTHQLMGALEKAGFTPAHLTQMGQSQKQLILFRSCLDGTSKVKPVQPPKEKLVTFKVSSTGKTGKEWIEYFAAKEIAVLDRAKEIVLSEEFLPSKKDAKYNVVIIKGDSFCHQDVKRRRVLAEAKRRGYKIPPFELACLIRDKFTNGDIELLGLRKIIVMHKPPAKKHDNDWCLLSIDTAFENFECLGHDEFGPEDCGQDDRGFAFIF